MSTFTHRLKFYLAGVVLGIGAVYGMLWKDRDIPAWLPADIILSKLDTIPLRIPEGMDCNPGCRHLGKADVQLLFKKSSVVFGKSGVHAEPCPDYYLIPAGKGSGWKYMRVRLCGDHAEIMEWEASRESGNCVCP